MFYFYFTCNYGLTLGQVFECTGRCVAVSEPNSPSFVSFKYRKFGDSSELRQLARDVIRWECRPYPSMEPPPLGYLLKLTAPCAVVLPMFRQRLLLTVASCHARFPSFRCRSSVAVSPFPLAVAVSVHRCRCALARRRR